jgi:hypothetical protein
MRILMTSAAALLIAGATALPAAPSASASTLPAIAAVQAPVSAYLTVVQEPQAQPQSQGGEVKLKVDINDNSGTVWYADPFWIAIGVIALVVVVLLVALATRGGGTTTVVR